jgi:hypothetical protein
VEITPDALQSYLDKKLGAYGRMTDWSYNFTASLLRRLGFDNLSQVDSCLSGYNDDRISRAVWGSRQGQLSRFEDTLLAAMGENFVSRHPWTRTDDAWIARFRNRLEMLRKAGIRTGAYDPAVPEAVARSLSCEPSTGEQVETAKVHLLK